MSSQKKVDIQTPETMKNLSFHKGYRVPWFVAKINDKFDFRIADQFKLKLAVDKKLCWICGSFIEKNFVFVIGPMCAVNRVNAEPPSHLECAEYAAKVCPFLIQEMVKRNTLNMPKGTEDAAGIPIDRQPGAVCLWICREYSLFDAGNGMLMSLGKPIKVVWMRMGRLATREEVLESISSGLPLLRDLAKQDGLNGQVELEFKITEALKLLPTSRKFLGSMSKKNFE